MKKITLCCMTLLIVFAHAQPNLTTNLQACYDLNCTTGSITTNGASTGAALNGTLHGNVTCAAGHLGTPSTAVQFGGTSLDYVALPNSPLIRPTNSITIAGWFYVTNSNYETIVFTKNACASTQPGYSISSNNGWFSMTKYPPACGTGTIVSTAATALYTWHFVVAYADNSKLKVSVDNAAPVIISHTVAFNYDAAAQVILGGTNLPSTNFPFSGKMDNIRFYNRELSTSEISKLYNFDPDCNDLGLPPLSDFNFSNNIICEGESINYFNNSANTSNAWNWQFEGGSPSTSNLLTPVINYNSPGVYTVSMVASNNYGVGNSVTKTVTVTTCNALNEFTNQEQQPQIFPNPASGHFTINHVLDCDLTILDLSGRIIKVVSSSAENMELNCSNIPSGIYSISVQHKVSGTNKVLKLVLY